MPEIDFAAKVRNAYRELGLVAFITWCEGNNTKVIGGCTWGGTSDIVVRDLISGDYTKLSV